MKNQILQYYMHDGPSAFRFELAGDLDREGASRLEQDWRTASSVIGDRALIVDLTFVTSADADGRRLLARWHGEGAQLIAKSKVSRELAESVIGAPLGDFAEGRTWLPFHTALGGPKLHMAVLLAWLLLPMQSQAATLKAETVAAWDDYVQSVDIALQDRTRPAGTFLWTYEDPERIAKVHNGQIVVAPAPGPSPRRVPGGLIHHWIGGAFLPGTKLDDVLEVTRDYDRYKEFYRPSVIESKAVARRASTDEFSMVLMNKAFFLKTALDADYYVNNVRLGDRRFYSVSKTTRIQEIEDYGQPGEHRTPDGSGVGLIWKLLSVARMEQRDGGVYVELEAIALSRDIPGAVRFVVDPIVKRISRNSIFTSLEQTAGAVRLSSLADTKRDGVPTGAEHVTPSSADPKNRSAAFARIP